MTQIITGNDTPMLFMGDPKLLTEDDLRKSNKRRRIEQSALTRYGNMAIALKGAPYTVSSETLMKRQKLNENMNA